MDETTLFLGPDPDIMRHHQIAPRTAHESYCMTSDTDPIEADRIRKRIAGALDEAFEMCESMGAAPAAKWADLSVAFSNTRSETRRVGNDGVITGRSDGHA